MRPGRSSNWRKLLVLALLACIGCGSAPRTYYRFALEGGPDGDLTRLTEAAADWNRCGVVRIDIEGRWEEGSSAIPVRYDGETDIPGHSSSAAVTHLDGRDAWLIEYLGGFDTTALLEHEMGHALMGPNHYGDKLMRGYANPDGLRVSADDCARLRER